MYKHYHYSRFFLILICFLAILTFNGLQAKDTIDILKAKVKNGDTMIFFQYSGVEIVHNQTASERRNTRRFERLVRDVGIAMPYAKAGARFLAETDSILTSMDNERERRKYLDRAEENIKRDFEADLKNLTFRQGLILIKLIDRETGNTSYELLREYRSNFTAFFWQGFARVFGMNLKTRYDPIEEFEIEFALMLLGYD